MAKKLRQGLCINLKVWDEEGDEREVQKGGIYVYLWLIQGEVWQKTTKLCKAKKTIKKGSKSENIFTHTLTFTYYNHNLMQK